jgi:aminopeptidase 2
MVGHSQPVAARRAFPCFDEPLLKATFAVTLISRAGTVNLSNMPVISEIEYTPSSGGLPDERPLEQIMASLSVKDQSSTEKWKITKFQTTPPVCAGSYVVFYRIDFVRLSLDVNLHCRLGEWRFCSFGKLLHKSSHW